MRTRDLWRRWDRVWAIATKEATHIRRDPAVLWMAIGMPVLLLLLFGNGISFDMDHVPVAVVDEDHTTASRQLVRDLTASNDLQVVAEATSPDAALHLLQQGRVTGAFVIPRGMQDASIRLDPVPIQLLVDGSDPASTNQVLAKADGLMRSLAQQRLGLGETRSIDVRTWTRYNPTGKSALFMVPGIIAYILAMVAVMLTALSVAREWERGSMEQLFATPVGRLEVVIGKLLPYMGLGYVQTLLALAAGATMFDMPVRGLPLVLFASGLFMLGMLGQGLLISVVTKNQMVAMQMATFSSMLPSMLLSGFLFPVKNMPLPLQALSFVVPARWFITTLRGVLLKGNTLLDVLPSLGMLTLFAVVMITASTRRFTRRVA